jgi:uncharacterized protein YoaH (UPF0181 family)
MVKGALSGLPFFGTLTVSLCQGAVERVQAIVGVHESAGELIELAAFISKRLQPLLREFEGKDDPEAIETLNGLVTTSFYAFRLGHDMSLTSKDKPKKSLARKAGSLVLAFICAKSNEEALEKVKAELLEGRNAVAYIVVSILRHPRSSSSSRSSFNLARHRPCRRQSSACPSTLSRSGPSPSTTRTRWM